MAKSLSHPPMVFISFKWSGFSENSGNVTNCRCEYSVPWSVSDTTITVTNTLSYAGSINGADALYVQGLWFSSLVFGSSANGNNFNKENMTNYLNRPLMPLDGSPMDEIVAGGSAPLNLSSFTGPQIYCGLDNVGETNGLNPDRFIAICDGNFTYPVTTYGFNCPSKSVEIVDPLLTPKPFDKAALYPNNTDLASMSKSGYGFFLAMPTHSNDTQNGVQAINFGSFIKNQVTTWTCFVNTEERNSTTSCHPESDSTDYGNGLLDCSFESIGESIKSNTTPFSDSTLTLTLFQIWQAIDKGSQNGSSMTEQFLASGSIRSDPWLADISQVDNITFATRFTALFNTLLMIVNQFGDPPIPWINSTSQTPPTLLPFTVVKCNWLWFGILLFTSLLLIVCSVLSAWLRYSVNTPDIMGYVSSLTIENPYARIVEVEHGSGSALDGLDRTRLMKNVRVRIGDVWQGEKIGKLAFAIEGPEVAEFQKGKKVV